MSWWKESVGRMKKVLLGDQEDYVAEGCLAWRYML